MKLRKNDPWMSAAEYGRGLRGLTINLLVRDVAAALRFQLEVLGAQAIYSDPDFAVLQHGEAEWMLHADHTCCRAGDGIGVIETPLSVAIPPKRAGPFAPSGSRVYCLDHAAHGIHEVVAGPRSC